MINNSGMFSNSVVVEVVVRVFLVPEKVLEGDKFLFVRFFDRQYRKMASPRYGRENYKYKVKNKIGETNTRTLHDNYP